MNETNNNDYLTRLESLLQSEKPSEVIAPIGREEGNLLTLDFGEMPHIFITGTTGSGKTSFIQTVMAEMMLKYRTDKVTFVVYDSKGTEYNVFYQNPYFLFPPTASPRTALTQINYILGTAMRRSVEGVHVDENLWHIFVILDDFHELVQDRENLEVLEQLMLAGSHTRVHVILVSSLPFPRKLLKDFTRNGTCRITFDTASKAISRDILGEETAENLRVPGEFICRWITRRMRCRAEHLSIKELEEVNRIAKELKGRN